VDLLRTPEAATSTSRSRSLIYRYLDEASSDIEWQPTTNRRSGQLATSRFGTSLFRYGGPVSLQFVEFREGLGRVPRCGSVGWIGQSSRGTASRGRYVTVEMYFVTVEAG